MGNHLHAPKVISFVLAFLMLSVDAKSQNISDHVVLHRGYFLGAITSPRMAVFTLDSAGNLIADRVGKQRTGFQFGLNWGTSVLLHSFDEDRAIRLAASLAGSVYMTADITSFELENTDVGWALQIPIVVNYHIGHFATKMSTRDNGFSFGAGIEINRFSSSLEKSLENGTAFISNNNNSNTTELYTNNKYNYVQPVVSLGYSYWTSSDKVRTLNLQFGFGKIDEINGTRGFRPSFRLSLHRHINY